MPKPIVVNPRRQDPYKNFPFRILFGGKVVAAARGVSGLAAKSAPGLSKGSIITLTHGVTGDAGFAEWTSRFAGSTSLAAARRPMPRSLVLRMHDETGKVAASWKLIGCSVEAFQHSPSNKDIAIEALKLQPVSLEPC